MKLEGEKGWTILVVDDNPETIRLISAELAGKGFQILQAQSAEEAARLMLGKATRPHLVLLDVIMPGLDGKKLCRFIKSNEMFNNIKVVLCSSMEREKLKQTAKECGADGAVHKEDILGRWVVEQLRRMEQIESDES